MEVPGGKSNKLTVCFYEALGTAGLIIAINWSATTDNPLNANVIGMYIMTAALCWGGITGGHFNAAITIAVFMKEARKSRLENYLFFFMIIFAQVIGAAVGVCIVRGGVVLKDCQIYPNIGKLCPPQFLEDEKLRPCEYSEGKQVFNMFIVETFGTFLFVSLVLNIKYHYGHSKAIINCLIVGFSLQMVIGLTGGITGGCINPTIALVQSIYQYVMTYQAQNSHGCTTNDPMQITSLQSLWVYLVATVLGGIIAGIWEEFHNHMINVMNIDAKANKDDRIQMITVDTNIQAERFKFLKVEDPSLSKRLMDPFTEKNIDETIL